MINKESALTLARYFHAGQKDKAGNPYIDHVLAVANDAMWDVEPGWEHDMAYIAGLLHDSIEDGATTVEKLSLAGASRTLVVVLEHLTRKQGESYNVYISRVCENFVACLVKRADLRHNLDPARMALLDPMEASSLSARYRKALSSVEAALAKFSAERAEQKLREQLSPEGPSPHERRQGESAHGWLDKQEQDQ